MTALHLDEALKSITTRTRKSAELGHSQEARKEPSSLEHNV